VEEVAGKSEVNQVRAKVEEKAVGNKLIANLLCNFQRRRLRVRAAFFAAAERDRAERCLATRFACLDKACLDAERRLSRLSARIAARERFREGFVRRPTPPFARSRFAWRFVRCLPRFGGGNFTPARRALDSPMAIACSGDRAPCSPSRMCSISSRTNSPA
jgi:hypothetical protein